MYKASKRGFLDEKSSDCDCYSWCVDNDDQSLDAVFNLRSRTDHIQLSTFIYEDRSEDEAYAFADKVRNLINELDTFLSEYNNQCESFFARKREKPD